MTHDVLTLGEAMLRLSPPAGIPLHRTTTLDVHVAGSEANVAVALASLGRSVAWVSRLPTGPLGGRVARDLAAAGVNLDFVGWDPDGRLGTYFVDLGAGPSGISVTYDRRDSSCTAMSSANMPWSDISQSRLVHLTGITPALSVSCREATGAVAEAVLDTETLLSVDVNYRAKLWTTIEARRCLEQIAAGAALVICTKEDAEDVFDIRGEPSDAASLLGDRLGADHVVVTSGARGAVLRSAGQVVSVEAMPSTIVDRLGAGDAFAAGLIDGLLDGDIAGGLTRGAALAAVALSTHGDQVTVTRPELMAVLETGRRTLDR